jgi:hypothetical protein
MTVPKKELWQLITQAARASKKAKVKDILKRRD